MRRKQRIECVAKDLELANQMLSKSQEDLARVQIIKSPVINLVRRVAELNQENNFSRRIAAAYSGVMGE